MRNILFVSSVAVNLVLVILLINNQQHELVAISEEEKQTVASIESAVFDDVVLCETEVIVANESVKLAAIESSNVEPLARAKQTIVSKRLQAATIVMAEDVQSVHLAANSYRTANPNRRFTADEAQKILTLSLFSTEDLQLDALDLVSDTLNSDHLSLLNEYIYSTNVEIQEEAFLRLSEIGVSESSIELFEYYLGHSSEWVQQDSTLALQQFYLRQ